MSAAKALAPIALILILALAVAVLVMPALDLDYHPHTQKHAAHTWDAPAIVEAIRAYYNNPGDSACQQVKAAVCTQPFEQVRMLCYLRNTDKVAGLILKKDPPNIQAITGWPARRRYWHKGIKDDNCSELDATLAYQTARQFLPIP